MKKTNNKSAKRKLIPAIAMLTCSAVMLSTATYAWFTMNKEVKVTGMEVKAHAEEGLLINEVKTATDTNWDEEAIAGQSTVFALRPASTNDLDKWWHANSLKSADEAGVDEINNTVAISEDVYYADISTSKVTDHPAVAAAAATGGEKAETHVYYSDASFGTASQYDDGEGFYVNYKYYLKASSTTELAVPAGKLGVAVTAELKDSEATATDLDKALRVGVKIDDDFLIFAPTGGDAEYFVTTDTAGTKSANKVEAKTAKTGINTGAISIPAVNSNGKLVDVYVWFEGEDQNCMSDNLTATLNAYTITINFTDDAI